MAAQPVKRSTFYGLFKGSTLSSKQIVVIATAIDTVYPKRYRGWVRDLENMKDLVDYEYGKDQWRDALKKMRIGEGSNTHCLRALYWLYNGRFGADSDVPESFAAKCVAATDDVFKALWGNHDELYASNLSILGLTPYMPNPVQRDSLKNVNSGKIIGRALAPQSHVPIEPICCSVSIYSPTNAPQEGDEFNVFLRIWVTKYFDIDSYFKLGFKSIRVELSLPDNVDAKIQFSGQYKDPGFVWKDVRAELGGTDPREFLLIAPTDSNGVLDNSYDFEKNPIACINLKEVRADRPIDVVVTLWVDAGQDHNLEYSGNLALDEKMKWVIEKLKLLWIGTHDPINGRFVLASQTLRIVPVMQESI